VQELDDVDAAFAAFVFRDETLVFAQFVCQLLLGEPSSVAGIDQVLGQAHMFSRAQGLQGGGLRVRARICNPALRLSQFRIRWWHPKLLAYALMITDEDSDTTKVVEHSPIRPPAEYSAWMRLRPRIARELLELATAGSLPTGAALKRVCHHLFGVDCTPQDETRFLIFAAPIARKIAIGMANRGDRIGESDVKVQDLVEWLGWLDRFDPMCATMIDLHYFAGLTAKQTAAALRLSPEVVIRDLRFAKAWLQTKLI
jgi:ECF sigma factor